MATRSARSYRSRAPARDGRRRLRAVDRDAAVDAKNAPTAAWKPRRRGFHTAHRRPRTREKQGELPFLNRAEDVHCAGASGRHAAATRPVHKARDDASLLTASQRASRPGRTSHPPAQIQRRTVARYESNAGPKVSRSFDSSSGMMNH